MADPEELESTAGVDVEADGNGESVPCKDCSQTDGQVRPQSNSFMFTCAAEAVIILLSIYMGGNGARFTLKQFSL